MAEARPIPVYQVASVPTRQIGSTSLPTSAPTATKPKPARLEAHGQVGARGSVTIEVSGACVLTLYIWSPASNTWRLPSSGSAGYSKTFAAAGFDYFTMEPGALFFIKSDTGSITGYTDAPAAPSN